MKNYQKMYINNQKQTANLSQLSYIKINKNVKNIVNTLRSDPTSGQTQSNYSLAIAGKLFECV